MNFEKFSENMKDKMIQLDIVIDNNMLEKFYNYMNILLEWNKKINLTAITDQNEIILKHFVDCATILKEVNKSEKVLDIGTGAGFPGLPLKILNSSLDITLVDSLNKRINFLNEVINKLDLKTVRTIHSRAEDLAIVKEHRENYDCLVSRAVAPLNVLLEYTLPFVKMGGKCICMKGSNFEEEIKISKKALNILGGNIKEIKEVTLPDTDIKRYIIIIEKIKSTPKSYPRKAGKPSKEPII